MQHLRIPCIGFYQLQHNKISFGHPLKITIVATSFSSSYKLYFRDDKKNLHINPYDGLF
jgi:hypothetical protein